MCDRGDVTLSFEDVEFGCLSKRKEQCAVFDAEWLGSFSECDVKFFAIHLVDLAIEYG